MGAFVWKSSSTTAFHAAVLSGLTVVAGGGVAFPVAFLLFFDYASFFVLLDFVPCFMFLDYVLVLGCFVLCWCVCSEMVRDWRFYGGVFVVIWICNFGGRVFPVVDSALCLTYVRIIGRIVRWWQIQITSISQNLFGKWLISPELLQWSKSIFQDSSCLSLSEVGFSLFCSLSQGIYVADLCATYSYKEVCPIGWVLQPAPPFTSLLTLDVQKAVGVLEGAPAFVASVVNQTLKNVARIHGLAVKKIAVSGAQPLGCLPLLTASSSFSRCNSTFNTLATLHNTLLSQGLAKLKEEANDNSSIVVLDLYDSFMSVLNHPSTHNIRNQLSPCCVGVSRQYSCGSVDPETMAKKYTVCDDPKSAFFWDLLHPTQAGWRAVYNNLLATHALQ